MEGSHMWQVRHESATTTPAVRAAIQRSQASLATLSRELVINPKTVAKWRKRMTVSELSPVRPTERPFRPGPASDVERLHGHDKRGAPFIASAQKLTARPRKTTGCAGSGELLIVALSGTNSCGIAFAASIGSETKHKLQNHLQNYPWVCCEVLERVKGNP
jgi:transposase-like protein